MKTFPFLMLFIVLLPGFCLGKELAFSRESGLPDLSFSVPGFDSLRQAFFFRDTCPDIVTTFEYDFVCGQQNNLITAHTSGPAAQYEYVWQDPDLSGAQLQNLAYGAYPFTVTDGNCNYEDTLHNFKVKEVLATPQLDLRFQDKILLDGEFVYVLGEISSAQDADSDDVIFTKINLRGDTIWSKIFASSNDDLSIDLISNNNGGFLLFVEIGINDLDFNTLSTEEKIAVITITSDGQVEQIIGTALPTYNYNRKKRSTTDGGFYQIYTFSGSVTYGRNDIIVERYSRQGEMLWSKNFGGTKDEYIYDVVVLDDNSIVLLSESVSLDYDLALPLSQGEKGKIWILKLNEDGEILWTHLYGQDIYAFSDKLELLSNGGLLVSGIVYHGNSNAWGMTGNSETFFALQLDEHGDSTNFNRIAPEALPAGDYINDVLVTSTSIFFYIVVYDQGYLAETDRNLQLKKLQRLKVSSFFADFPLIDALLHNTLNADEVRLVGDHNVRKTIWNLHPDAAPRDDYYADQIICNTQDITITPDAPFCTGCSLVWSDGDTTLNKPVSITDNTTLYAFITDENGCEHYDEVNVKVSDSYIAFSNFLKPNCDAKNGRVSAALQKPETSDIQYLWSTGDTSAILQNIGTGNYSVTVTDGVCVREKSVSLPLATSYSIENLFRYDLDGENICEPYASSSPCTNIVADVATMSDNSYVYLCYIDGNHYVVKRDLQTNDLIWQVRIWVSGNPYWQFQKYQLTELSNGNLAVLAQGVFVLLNRDGAITKIFATSSVYNGLYAYSFLETPDHEIFFFGTTNLGNDQPPGQYKSYTGTILKVSADFIPISYTFVGGTSNDQINKGILTSDGYLLLAGASRSTDLDNARSASCCSNSTDSWLVKMDLSGNVVFSLLWGSKGDDAIYAVEEFDNNYYCVVDVAQPDGFFSDNTNIGATLMSVSSEGFFNWKRVLDPTHLGSSTNYYPHKSYDIKIRGNSEIYVPYFSTVFSEVYISTDIAKFNSSGNRLESVLVVGYQTNLTQRTVALAVLKNGDLLTGGFNYRYTTHYPYSDFYNYLTASVNRIRNSPLPQTNLFPDLQKLCEGNSILLNAYRSGYTSYLWSTGDTLSAIHADTAGTYWARISTGPECTFTDTIRVIESPNTLISPAFPDTVKACHMLLDAGNPGSTYAWSTGHITQMAEIKHPGNYSLIIRDANGCSESDAFYFDSTTDIALLTDTVSISCFDSNDGAIYLSAEGGIPPYAFNIHHTDTSQYTSLYSGNYYLAVTDSTGCCDKDTIHLNQPDLLDASYRLEYAPDHRSATVFLDITGGTPPYEVVWNIISFGGNVLHVDSTGYYQALEVRDANGCSYLPGESVFVELTTTATTDTPSAENLLQLFPNPTTGTLNILIAGEALTENSRLMVYDILGRKINEWNGEALLRRRGQLLQVNIEGNAAGLYFVRLKNGNAEQVRSFVLTSQ